MKFFVISDNIDTYMGMRLTGAQGVVVHQKSEVLDALAKSTQDSSIGVILITTKLMNLCRDVILDYKLNIKRPLLVEIPDRHATANISDTISHYIKESIGITI